MVGMVIGPARSNPKRTVANRTRTRDIFFLLEWANNWGNVPAGNMTISKIDFDVTGMNKTNHKPFSHADLVSNCANFRQML